MAYELCFTEDFFAREGELDGYVSPSNQPRSVMQAIASMAGPDWTSLAYEVFGLDSPDYLDPHAVLTMVRETNTCSNLNSPVYVWIDPDGVFTLPVYD